MFSGRLIASAVVRQERLSVAKGAFNRM